MGFALRAEPSHSGDKGDGGVNTTLVAEVAPGSIKNSSTTVALDRIGDRQDACPTMAVRRLTPRECERLQGFPDDFTLVEFNGKPACDGPRYKAIGNSMAVPMIEWLGRRIELVDELLE